MGQIHPAPAEFTAGQLDADPILRYFHYAHLPTPLQEISSAFCSLAAFMVEALPRNAERSAGLRKLLEAKDCAVRANVGNLKPRAVDDFPVEGEIRTTGGGSVETPIPFRSEPPAGTPLTSEERRRVGLSPIEPC